jgi:hypothetical protein
MVTRAADLSNHQNPTSNGSDHIKERKNRILTLHALVSPWCQIFIGWAAKPDS